MEILNLTLFSYELFNGKAKIEAQLLTYQNGYKIEVSLRYLNGCEVTDHMNVHTCVDILIVGGIINIANKSMFAICDDENILEISIKRVISDMINSVTGYSEELVIFDTIASRSKNFINYISDRLIKYIKRLTKNM